MAVARGEDRLKPPPSGMDDAAPRLTASVPVPEVSISLLGPVRIGPAARAVRLAGAKPRAVLAALALRHGHVVSTDQLIDDLWAGGMPATARNTVQVYVSAVRRALDEGAGPVRLESRPGGYVLTGSKEHVDWHLFESLATRGRALRALPDEAAAGRLLAQALSLWDGTPLADVGDVPLAVMARAQAEAARLAVLGDRIEADLACDRAGLVAELIGLTREHPLDERFAGQLMRALHRSGRRAEAGAEYHRLRGVLAEETALEPGLPLQQLYQQLLAEDGPAQAATATATAGVGPAPTRPPDPPSARRDLVGRAGDLQLLRHLADGHRLVTVVGPAGVGKSAVAEQLAVDLAAAGAVDAVWFLGVESVQDAARLPAALLGRAGGGPDTGLDEVDQLRRLLLGRSVTLLLDNADHLATGCVELIRSLCPERPGLRVVVTAHRPLGLAEEVAYRLDPLPVPAESVVDVEELGTVASVELFLARARQVLPRFALTPANTVQVATACRLLDGLPLAVELAAARLRLLSVAELTDRLRERLDTLDPPARADGAGSSLRGSLQLSWAALEPSGRQALGALSTCTGGFTSSAAEALLAGPGVRPLDALQDLIDRSLVLADTEVDETRYRLLNTVRQFVLQQVPAEDAERARHRRAAFLRALTARAAQERRGALRLTWLRRLAAERPAIEATLGWADDHSPELMLELLASLWWWWCERPAEGSYWYRRGLAGNGTGAVGPTTAPTTESPARLQALLGAAVVTSYVRPTEALEYARQARELAEAVGSPTDRIRAEQHLADIGYELGDLPVAQQHGDAALALAERHGPPYALARCLLTVAYNHLGALELAAARARASAALATFRRCEDPAGMADAQLLITEVDVLLARHRGQGAGHLGLPARTAARTAAAFRREQAVGQLARALVQRAWCSDDVDDPGGRQRTAWLHEAFTLHAQVAHRWSVARDLDLVADLCADGGHHLKAAILLGAAESVRAEMDAVLLPRDLAVRLPLIAECMQVLGPSTYRSAAALGAACDLAGAVAEVLTLPPVRGFGPRRRGPVEVAGHGDPHGY